MRVMNDFILKNITIKQEVLYRSSKKVMARKYRKDIV